MNQEIIRLDASGRYTKKIVGVFILFAIFVVQIRHAKNSRRIDQDNITEEDYVLKYNQKPQQLESKIVVKIGFF